MYYKSFLFGYPAVRNGLYHLVFRLSTPKRHIKIDDEERQLSDQFPHRPRSRLISILKMLLLNLPSPHLPFPEYRNTVSQPP
jgi:hypothetical protein